MNATQTKILDLFDTLADDEQAELAEQLYQRSRPSFLAGMDAAQRAELEAGMAEAARGEGSEDDQVFEQLEKAFGVKLA